MIKQWKLFNFKSVRNETDLDFAPLTIFAGPNSSGKSTVLQSILLVAQTMAHKVSSRSVVLNGALTRLGQFDDLKTSDSDANQIVIGWTCEPRFARNKVLGRALPFRHGPTFYSRYGHRLVSAACEIAFEAEESGDQREITQIQPRLYSAILTAVMRDSGGVDQRHSISIRRASTADYTGKQRWIDASDAEGTPARASMDYQVELDELSLAEIREELASAEPIGCSIRHFLPQQLALGVDMVAEDTRAILSLLAGEGPRGYLRRMSMERMTVVPVPVIERLLQVADQVETDEVGVRTRLSRRLEDGQQSLLGKEPLSIEQLYDALRGLNPRLRLEIGKKLSEDDDFASLVKESVHTLRSGEKEERAVLLFPAPRPIAGAISYTDQFFSASLRYLGPLRDEPKSLYPLSPTADPSDVGNRGEHTAAVLELHKNHQVEYIPSSACATSEIDTRPVVRSLQNAVADWLRYLDVAQHVESRDKGKFGHEVKVKLPGSEREHDLTHVGVGVSQVLPILVVSLLAEPDTTLVFEQPELHLHPRVQTLLADFFLTMTQLGKQCVIETHSEYLINRIRFRTAAAVQNNPWIDAVNLYFVEKGQQGSSFREVSINEFGAILDWPEGFFDQSQHEAEAILRAASSKRASKRRR